MQNLKSMSIALPCNLLHKGGDAGN